MYKKSFLLLFGFWILLQIYLNIKIFHNPMNYFVPITLFFLCVQALLKHKR